MKPRARRVTVAAAVLGAGILAVLVVTHWSTVRDHVEAWRFQVTRETETIVPDSALREVPIELEPDIFSPEWFVGQTGLERVGNIYSPGRFFPLLANCVGCPVIFASKENVTHVSRNLFKYLTAESARKILETNGYRVLEQRFPRSAYVVIREKATGVTSSVAEVR